MPIDYLEYYSGQCFGAIGTNSETVCDEHIGADIDAELEDHIDEQLFGSSNRRRRNRGLGKYRRKLRKTDSGMILGNRMYRKLEDFFLKLRRSHIRGKKVIKRIEIAKKAGNEEHVSKLTKRLEVIKENMKKMAEKIASIWRTRRDKFKQKWVENHKDEAWKSPAAFIAKHGHHNLQLSE